MKLLVPSLLLALGLAACSGTSPDLSSSTAAINSTTTTGTSGVASALTVGQIVSVTFDANGAAATIVAGAAGFRGGMGFGPMGDGGPEGMPHEPGTVVDFTKFGRVYGTADAVDASAGTLTVLGLNIVTDSSTLYRGVTSLADVAVGAEVGVRINVADDGSLVALAVSVKVPSLGGAISAVAADGSSITVLGREIPVTDATTVTVVEPPTMMGDGHSGPGGFGGGMHHGGMMGG